MDLPAAKLLHPFNKLHPVQRPIHPCSLLCHVSHCCKPKADIRLASRAAPAADQQHVAGASAGDTLPHPPENGVHPFNRTSADDSSAHCRRHDRPADRGRPAHHPGNRVVPQKEPVPPAGCRKCCAGRGQSTTAGAALAGRSPGLGKSGLWKLVGFCIALAKLLKLGN